MTIPVVVQHRHVHLSAADLSVLFGSKKPTVLSVSEHEGQVVYRETVTVLGKRGFFENIHVIGPAREASQVELSAADAFALGLDPPLRLSGDTARSVPCTLKGPNGEVRIPNGLIIPARHLHCSTDDAKALGVAHLDVISLALQARPDTVIDSVTVRVHPTYRTCLHLTEDEAAEFWLHTGDLVVLK
jgi:putative phosphotransacetylase